MKFTVLCITLSVFFVLSVGAQDASPALAKYSAGETGCVKSFDAGDWKASESLCNDALALSIQLPQKFKLEKMNALENYGFTQFRQSKFQLALSNFTKALNIGTSFLKGDSTDLAHAYFNVGRANQGMASITSSYIVPAETNYLQAEKIYRAAYAAATDADGKGKIKESIQRTLGLLKYIAQMRGEDAKVKAIEARMAEFETEK